MKIINILFWFLSVVFAQLPIPKTPFGISYGNTVNPKVIFEVFLDLHCPDSKEAFKISQYLLTNLPDKSIQIKYHFYPLPYHPYAFPATALAFAIAKEYPNQLLTYVNNTFNHLAEFYDIPHKSFQQVIDQIVDIGVESGLERSFLAASIQEPINTNTAKQAWKYGANRGVYATPQFYVNGVYVTDENVPASVWFDLLNKLVSSSSVPVYVKKPTLSVQI
ncbi:hypothetical protein BC833DRAFT_620482 [Globomyces pollinis-pini]|nr:hypothetical protein BC833DRAFT_620482 [Globomyces pollinis-pini]